MRSRSRTIDAVKGAKGGLLTSPVGDGDVINSRVAEDVFTKLPLSNENPMYYATDLPLAGAERGYVHNEDGNVDSDVVIDLSGVHDHDYDHYHENDNNHD